MGWLSRVFGLELDEASQQSYEAEQNARRRALLKKVRRLEILTRRVVNDQMAGSYHSAFKGRGMDFDEVRAYQEGDDVRSIDWNVSARMDGLYVKRFVEERELTVFLMVDASGSQSFGTKEFKKREVAAEIGAVLAFSAIKNNDRVGLIIFTDQIELFVPPKKGKKHVLRVIREILDFEPKHRGTDVAKALTHFNRMCKRSSVAFVISDFQSTGYKNAMSVAARRHDVVPIVVQDPAEVELPNVGTVAFEDPETGEVVWVDTASASGRAAYQKMVEGIVERREKVFHRMKVDFVNVNTHKSTFEPIVNYFKLRSKR